MGDRNLRRVCQSQSTASHGRSAVAILILSRKVHEWIELTTAAGEVVRIVVSEISREQGQPRAKLGIEAPESVRIRRMELPE